MDCNRCGVCCIEISISSPLPGMPNGKPAGVRCPHLAITGLCQLFQHPERPAVCSSFNASAEICGNNAEDATKLIRWYEQQTSPN